MEASNVFGSGAMLKLCGPMVELARIDYIVYLRGTKVFQVGVVKLSVL